MKSSQWHSFLESGWVRVTWKLVILLTTSLLIHFMLLQHMEHKLWNQFHMDLPIPDWNLRPSSHKSNALPTELPGLQITVVCDQSIVLFLGMWHGTKKLESFKCANVLSCTVIILWLSFLFINRMTSQPLDDTVSSQQGQSLNSGVQTPTLKAPTSWEDRQANGGPLQAPGSIQGQTGVKRQPVGVKARATGEPSTTDPCVNKLSQLMALLTNKEQ